MLRHGRFSTIIIPTEPMMRVKLKLMQPLSGLVGARELWVEMDGGTVNDMVAQLCLEHGKAVADELLDKGGDLDLAYAVSVDGDLVRSLSASLHYGAEVLIFSSIVGGAAAPVGG